MKTTAYHVEDSSTAERVCLQLATHGWTARWNDDQSWTHVYATHQIGETTRVNEVVLSIDVNATACQCRR